MSKKIEPSYFQNPPGEFPSRRLLQRIQNEVKEGKTLPQILKTIEEKRLSIVHRALGCHERSPFQMSLEGLSDTEKQAIYLFQTEVKPCIDQIESRQRHPEAKALSDWMERHGDPASKTLFRRFRHVSVGGPYATDPEGSLFPFFPDPPPINGMIDPSISLKEIQELGRVLPKDAEELRPTTILEKSSGKIIATPLPLHRDFKELHLKLAEALIKISSLDIDGPLEPTLTKQLLAWAKFFNTGSAQDEATAAQATIDAGDGKGLLRVHLGPSESYWEDQLKFPYLLQVGLREQTLIQALDDWKKVFPLLEQSLDKIPHYHPRTISMRGGFADPMYQIVIGGFIETFPFCEPSGNNFPNYSYPGVEGSNRFLVLESIQKSSHQLKEILTEILDEDIRDWEAHSCLIRVTAAHEAGHLIGPQRDHQTPDGLRMGTVFGHYWGNADEPKADLTIAPMVRLLRAEKIIDQKTARDLLRSLVARSLLTRENCRSAFLEDRLSNHAYGRALQAAYFFQTGALSLTKKGKIRINYDLLEKDAESLWKKIISFEAAGDKDGFIEFGKKIVATMEDAVEDLLTRVCHHVKPFFIERGEIIS